MSVCVHWSPKLNSQLSNKKPRCYSNTICRVIKKELTPL